MPDRPIDRWSLLRGTGQGDGTLEIPSLSSEVDSGYGPVRFAVGPGGEPRLLVPCGPGGRLTGNRSTPKLLLTLARLNVGSRPVTFIDLMSVDRNLDPVFAEIANEILHRLANGISPVGAVEGTIADFRELLIEKPAQEVEDRKILGLIGELIVLRKLIADAPSAIEAWVGPYEQRHDFRRGVHAIEVKTSSRADATSVTVSSCDQLAEPTGGTLTLVHVRVERADQGTLSVATLVEDIIATGASGAALRQGLAAMGCLDHKADAWNRMRVGLEGIQGYRVEAGFPRIISAHFSGNTLPDGIESLVYVVDLRAAKPFALGAAELESAIAGLAG